MILKRFPRAISITGFTALILAGNASAGAIAYTTNSSGTEFVAGVNSLILDSTGGQSSTLTFVPNTSSVSGTPSNINLGNFFLACATCTLAQTTTFSAFTFDLVVDDTTDGGFGEFVGTSTGGTVSSNSSTVQVDWTAPPGLQIGPGANNTTSGNFGLTEFDIVSAISLIVAPNSGTAPGDTTIEGQVSTAPEPATLALFGVGLLAVGSLGRKKFLRR
jgi:hypothetical protein